MSLKRNRQKVNGVTLLEINILQGRRSPRINRYLINSSIELQQSQICKIPLRKSHTTFQVNISRKAPCSMLFSRQHLSNSRKKRHLRNHVSMNACDKERLVCCLAKTLFSSMRNSEKNYDAIKQIREPLYSPKRTQIGTIGIL